MGIFLESPLKEQMDSLEEKSYKFFLDANYEEYEKVLLQEWDLLPEPKGQWKESLTVVRDLINNYFKTGNYEKARAYFDIAHKESGGRYWKRENVSKYLKFYKSKN